LVIVLMGVAGSGKSTVGSLLAAQLGWIFADGDQYHASASIEKMVTGIPLTDADRLPWLKRLRSLIVEWLGAEKNAVLACSALKQSYRELLQGDDDVHFVYLKASREMLSQRLRGRQDHYMKESMLDSQLTALEEPRDATVVNTDSTPENVVQRILTSLDLVQGP
jgi:gluconokinase